MGASKKGSGTKSGGKDRKLKQSPSSHSPSKRRLQNTTAASTQNNTSTTQALYSTPTQKPSGVLVADASNIYQTSHGSWLLAGAGQIQDDLLGLAPQTFQGYELGETHPASFIDSFGAMTFCEFPYHRPILMGDNIDGDEKNMNPMARWMAESNAEQPAILHLPDGQLSIHKDCLCSDMLQPGMEMEIKE